VTPAVELVAIDVEGSGAQDREREDILEIALVPIVDWRPDMASAYHTLINPQRGIPARPWISPGLTDIVLREAPPMSSVAPDLVHRVSGRYLVGHNVGVDWRLLHRRCPAATPVGLIDTLRLARQLSGPVKRDLAALTDQFGLVEEINRLASGSAPHRALWDTVAVALLLPRLAHSILGHPPDTQAVIAMAGTAFPSADDSAVQMGLFDS
jgi:DNA polymerase III epsilon subunit-like protein